MLVLGCEVVLVVFVQFVEKTIAAIVEGPCHMKDRSVFLRAEACRNWNKMTEPAFLTLSPPVAAAENSPR